MTGHQEVIALQTWWMGEIKAITKKVMAQEEKRQDRNRQKTDELLADYQSKDEILDAYGFGCITERQKDKLMDLWDQREEKTRPDSLSERKLKLLSELYEDAKKVIRDEEQMMGGVSG